MRFMDEFRITASKEGKPNRIWTRSTLNVAEDIADQAVEDLGYDRAEVINDYGGHESGILYEVFHSKDGISHLSRLRGSLRIMPKVTQTIELTEEEVKQAITDYLHRKFPGDARPFDIDFEVDMEEETLGLVKVTAKR